MCTRGLPATTQELERVGGEKRTDNLLHCAHEASLRDTTNQKRDDGEKRTETLLHCAHEACLKILHRQLEIVYMVLYKFYTTGKFSHTLNLSARTKPG